MVDKLMKTKQTNKQKDAGTVRLKRIIKTVFDYILCVCVGTIAAM